MDKQNITVENGNVRFNFRVAVLIKNKDRFLLESNGEFWNMIGGRVHYGDSTLEAIKREVKEEVGINIDNLRLVNISENFFPWMGKNQHELLFVYFAELNGDEAITKRDNFKSLDSNEIFKWHNKEDVANLVCKPEIIKTLVVQNEGMTHCVGN